MLAFFNRANMKYCNSKSVYVYNNACKCKYTCNKDKVMCNLTKAPKKFHDCECLNECNLAKTNFYGFWQINK